MVHIRENKKLIVGLIVVGLFSLASVVFAAETSVDASTSSGTSDQLGVFGPYWNDVNTGVVVFVDSGSDISYSRTTNGGVDWAVTEITTGTVAQTAVWFDKETPGDTGDLLHIGWINWVSGDGNSSAFYRTLDVSSDILGTQRTASSTTIGSSGSTANRISLTKTVSGNIIYAFENGTSISTLKSADNFATAGTEIADVYETINQHDWLKLYPANTADGSDAAAIYWDVSANSVTVKMYDDSGDTWTESAITAATDDPSHINMDAAVRLTDKAILLALHSDDDAAGDDLLTFEILPDSIASPTVTAKTNVFTNQDFAAQVGMVIDQNNDDVYVGYLKGGTWLATVDAVFHKSTDDMATWGAEQAYSEAAADDIRYIHGGHTATSAGGRIQWSIYNDDLSEIFVNLVNDVEIAGAAPPVDEAENLPINNGRIDINNGRLDLNL
jgi:hypothetical protein